MKITSQRVRVNGSYSESSPVVSGIPQGSILGPLLFIIFINDLPDCVKSICKIFADDTKLYDKVSNQKQLQEDLLALIDWSNKWQLKFNLSKCIFLHIGNHNENTHYKDKERTLILKNVSKKKRCRSYL